MVWRRFRIAGDTSLAELHFIIQIAQGWDDDYLHQFHIYGRDYGLSKPGACGFPDNSRQVLIDDFEFDIGDRFTYEYNFFESWLHDIRIEAVEEPSTRKRTPFCLGGNGMPGATQYDVYDRSMALLKCIVHGDQSLTVGDVRNHIEALNEVRFNRQKANKDLAQPDLEQSVHTQILFLG